MLPQLGGASCSFDCRSPFVGHGSFECTVSNDLSFRWERTGGCVECFPCPVGTYSKNETSICPQGEHSAQPGVSAADVCELCPARASVAAGSASADACIHPYGLNASLVAGEPLLVTLDGQQLRRGHTLRAMHACGAEFVAGFGPARGDAAGSAYDFGVPLAQGGEYRLCWCPGLIAGCEAPDHKSWYLRTSRTKKAVQGQRVGEARVDFAFDVGTLSVVGPHGDSLFYCVRGQVPESLHGFLLCSIFFGDT